MTVVGTIKTNRKGVGCLKKMDDRENNSTLIYWEKEKGTMKITSYVVNTKSSGKRNVLVLATANPILGVSKDDRKSNPESQSFTITSKEVLTSSIKRWENTQSSQNHLSGLLLQCRVYSTLLA